MVACGLPDVQMTSVAAEKGPVEPEGLVGTFGLGQVVAAGPVGPGGETGLMPQVRERVSLAVAQTLGRRQQPVTLERLQRQAASGSEVGAGVAGG